MTNGINRLRLKVLVAGFLITATGHLFIFGDSGVLMRNRLQEQLETLQKNIALLEKENANLNAKYADLANSKSTESETVETTSPPEETTILKFTKSEEPEAESAMESEQNGILEARIVFLVSMFFLTILAAVLAGGLFERKRERYIETRRTVDGES